MCSSFSKKVMPRKSDDIRRDTYSFTHNPYYWILIRLSSISKKDHHYEILIVMLILFNPIDSYSQILHLE